MRYIITRKTFEGRVGKLSLNSRFDVFYNILLSIRAYSGFMAKPVVSDMQTPHASWRGIFFIILAASAIYISFYVLDENVASVLVFPISVILPVGVSIVGFFVSKQYWRSNVFGRSYFMLGIGYMLYAIAEIIYYSLEILGISLYPSIADVFFFALYPFVFCHLVLNIRFFLKKLTIFQKIWLPGIAITIIMIYSAISLGESNEQNFDFWYGLIFISAGSVIFSASLLGALIFRQSELGTAWLLLSVGILINSVGDVWYYHLEIFEAYSELHVVDVIWHLSSIVMIYALYNHRFRLNLI